MRASHSVLREGAVAGLLGAGTVALWFLVRDTLAGLPFRTASVLGQVLLFLNPAPDLERVSAGAAAANGAFHLAAFLLVGWLLALLARWATQEPVARFALVVAFVLFVLFFYVVLRTVGGAVQELFPAWVVLVPNFLAAFVMGAYLWRRYPELQDILRAEPLGS